MEQVSELSAGRRSQWKYTEQKQLSQALLPGKVGQDCSLMRLLTTKLITKLILPHWSKTAICISFPRWLCSLHEWRVSIPLNKAMLLIFPYQAIKCRLLVCLSVSKQAR